MLLLIYPIHCHHQLFELVYLGLECTAVALMAHHDSQIEALEGFNNALTPRRLWTESGHIIGRVDLIEGGHAVD